MQVASQTTSALDWLLHSGIQNIRSGHISYGGFNSWYDLGTRNYSFVYPEITGYALSTFDYQISLHGPEDRLLESSRLAANWLCQIQRDDGSFPYSLNLDKHNFVQLFYTFDAAICITGLARLYVLTKDSRWLGCARRALKFILDNQNSDGSFNAVLDEKGQSIVGDHWSSRSSCHHAKNAIAILEIFKITNEPYLVESARKICNWVMHLQLPNGRYMTELDGSTYSHPHCYACEGMIYAGYAMNDKAYVNSGLSGLKWLAERVRRDGTIFRHYSNDHGAEGQTTDTFAQLIRIIQISHSLTSDDYSNETDILTKSLLDRQESQRSKRELHGGFYYDESRRHLNSWATMFALQSMEMLNAKENPPECIF